MFGACASLCFADPTKAMGYPGPEEKDMSFGVQRLGSRYQNQTASLPVPCGSEETVI